MTQKTVNIPTRSILEVINELTIGQRSSDTTQKLSTFLHSTIFKKLGPFAIEIYFQDQQTGKFIPPVSGVGPTEFTSNVPLHFHPNCKILKKLIASEVPVQKHSCAGDYATLDFTPNQSHLFIPVTDSKNLLGILYIGSQKDYSFSDEYCRSVQTLGAIIGSRVKSMKTIQQLKKSMRDLEHSEQIRNALNQISEQARQSININSLYVKLHQIVSQLIHAPNFLIGLVEKRSDGEYITFPYYADDRDPHFQGMEYPLNIAKHSLTSYLMKTRAPLLLTPDNFESVCSKNDIQFIGTRPTSWLGAPFFLKNMAGAVAVQSYGDTVYSEGDKELMDFVARHIGDALNRKRAIDELRDAKERAELAEKNKSTFLANMSHEIRTPMNGIMGLTNLVLHSKLSSQNREYLEMIYSSADRLLKLINDILDFSKIEAGKFQLDRGPFSLRNCLADALEILSVSAAQKNINLEVHCPQQIPDNLLGDGGKLSQVFINLVGNGIKFTDEGSVKVSIKEKKILNKGDGEAVELLFSVQDTGIGIPKDEVASVFEAFNQIGTTRNSSNRGTGLGLVIAAELVGMMGGEICVESKEGTGTTFFFKLHFPVVDADDNQSIKQFIPHISTNSHLDKTLNILLVEDEFINKTLALAILEREGWNIAVAEDGYEALEKFGQREFDLILMDIQMPKLNGFDTTRRIRKIEQNGQSHTPIIAMTAYAVKGDKEACLASGMDGYVSKPIRPEKLHYEIEMVLSQQQPKTENLPQLSPHTP